jgi:hypothetical protein
LEEPHKRILPLNLPSGSQVEIASALAQAAVALAAVARALGETAAPSHSLTAPPPSYDAPTLIECINEFLRAKARAGRSDGYLKIVRLQLRRLAHALPGRAVNSVSAKDLELWLDRLDCGGRHRR